MLDGENGLSFCSAHATATFSNIVAYRSKSLSALAVCHRHPLIKNCRSPLGMGPWSMMVWISNENSIASRLSYLDFSVKVDMASFKCRIIPPPNEDARKAFADVKEQMSRKSTMQDRNDKDGFIAVLALALKLLGKLINANVL